MLRRGFQFRSQTEMGIAVSLQRPVGALVRRLVLICIWLGVSSAFAAPPSFALGDGPAGPTCASFVSMGFLTWDRAGGDWADATGKLYGETAFATQPIQVSQVRQIIDFDITALIQNVLDARQAQATVLLRAKPNARNGIVEFHSRESPDTGARPMLKLKWSDGSQTRLSVASDTTLDCSTVYSLGALSNLKAGKSLNAVLRFDIVKPTAKLLQAVLCLVSDKQYAGATEIGVYRVTPPYERATSEVKYGIASAFVGDVGIENHPDVYFATGFENFAWIADWRYYDPRSNAESVVADVVRKFEPFSGKALRVRLVKGKNLGIDLRYSFSSYGEREPEEVYFRYYLRFGDDWSPNLDGGKLPGIAGTYGLGGWGMRKSDGYNGWSVRGGYAARPTDDKSVANLTSVGSYVYHVDIDASGDYWGWNQGPSGLMENNRWYAVEQYVKLNNPEAHDGIFRAWVDGQQVMEKTAIQFRRMQELKIESIWMNVYFGGVAPTPKDMTLYIDNVVVARKYIGPAKR